MKKSGTGARRLKGRRRFLKSIALGAGAATLPAGRAAGAFAGASDQAEETGSAVPAALVEYPRKFTGPRRKMITFPLGGVGSGSIGLGGRGELKEWWIFNRPDKGNSPGYAFPCLWVACGNRKPVAKVLEARILPPYEGPSGLGAANVPGLPRLLSCTFTGEFPLARVDFEDPEIAVRISLEAFTPFIPLDADDSGLPIALLRYTVVNPQAVKAAVSIAFSIENPVGREAAHGVDFTGSYGRVNEHRSGRGIEGLFMRNPFLPSAHPLAGSFALGVLGIGDGNVTYLRGWPSARWWESPLLFWEDFSADGRLGPESSARTAVGALCLGREIPARGQAEFTFLLSWHFPNRTPARCGWNAPKGHENDLLGNYYCTRFADAWAAAIHASERLPELERATRQFVAVMRETTLPAAVKDAASANLSTLVTPTVFRTRDGSFHGFEGSNDHSGCCFGSCTHVYAYEATIESLFPELSRSMRQQQFGFLTDAEGRMDYRELLPFGIEHFGVAAADGQMACLMKLYFDWRLSGDTEWLRSLWPGAKRAIEFCWIPGGWDANRDGVMEGAQHNTYDVEFIGPNPLCQFWYLGALRAAGEMAAAAGDADVAQRCRTLFERGSLWMDAHLFNGEYYIQQTGSIRRDEIAKGLMEGAGPTDTEHPTFQLGEGCLADQLVGQYYAALAGLELLADRDHLLKTQHSIYKYNFKRSLADHDSVQRTYALNNEAGLVVCTYPRGERPRTPFPYFAEVWSGIEYAVAALMFYLDMSSEGVELVESARRRFDGEKRNPWDEAECGYHYTRPMASWGAFFALSGVRYDGVEKQLTAKPRFRPEAYSSFWSAASAWGSLTQTISPRSQRVTLSVIRGSLAIRSLALARERAEPASSSVKLGARTLAHAVRGSARDYLIQLRDEVTVGPGQPLVVSLRED
ncbi:MAG: GH116 family glycosyl-hydrolase [Terriglobia bacterium]